MGMMSWLERRVHGLVAAITCQNPAVETMLCDISLPASPKVSFCTVNKGRLHQLKKTFVQNVLDQDDVPFVEFILLDYDSSDGMGGWVTRELEPFVKQGKVKYFLEKDRRFFHMTHAKNVAHMKASGDIVCNLDADNFLGRGFARYLVEEFRKDQRQVLHGSWRISPGTDGRVAMLREHFRLLGGYDERMQGWGFDDRDIIQRARNLGLRTRVIDSPDFLKALVHTNHERVEWMHPANKNMAKTRWMNRIGSWVRHLGRYKANVGHDWGRSQERYDRGME